MTRQPSSCQTVLDSAALNVPDISDHRMVRAKARIRKEVPPKYKALSDVKEPFQLRLSNRYAILEEKSDPDDIYDKISC